jgi:hypothetical protein
MLNGRVIIIWLTVLRLGLDVATMLLVTIYGELFTEIMVIW